MNKILINNPWESLSRFKTLTRIPRILVDFYDCEGLKILSPDCNGILFLKWLEKSAGEKDTVESRKQLLKM